MFSFLLVGVTQLKHKDIIESHADKEEEKNKFKNKQKKKESNYTPKNTYKAVVPKNICLNTLIREYPLKVKRKFKYDFELIDRIAGILDIILRKYLDSYKVKDFSMDVHISSAHTFKPFLDDYNDILDFLIISNVIDIVQEEEIGANSRSYRLSDEYRNEGLRYYYIQDENMIKKLTNRGSHKPSIERYPMLYKYLQELEIDVAEAIKRAEIILKDDDKKENKMSLYKVAFDNINSTTPSFKKDKSSGRLHTSITNLNKEFRPFLRYKGESLVEIDIKSSQPYFLACILKDETWQNYDIIDIVLKNSQYLSENEVLVAKHRLRKNTQFSSSNRLYIDDSGSVGSSYRYPLLSIGSNFSNLVDRSKMSEDFSNFKGSYSDLVVNGNLYEFISSNLQYETRDEGKNQMFNILFNPPHFECKGRSLFLSFFPEIIEFADTINKGYVKTKKQGRTKADQTSTLSLLLQTLEANFMLDSLVPYIQEKFPELALFTIHDSVLIPQGQESEVRACIEELAVSKLGLKPMLRVG